MEGAEVAVVVDTEVEEAVAAVEAVEEANMEGTAVAAVSKRGNDRPYQAVQGDEEEKTSIRT